MFVTVLLLAMMGGLGLAALDAATRDRDTAGYYNRETAAFYAAEAGIAARAALVSGRGQHRRAAGLPDPGRAAELGGSSLYCERARAARSAGGYYGDPDFPRADPLGGRSAGPVQRGRISRARARRPLATLWPINVKGAGPDGPTRSSRPRKRSASSARRQPLLRAPPAARTGEGRWRRGDVPARCSGSGALVLACGSEDDPQPSGAPLVRPRAGAGEEREENNAPIVEQLVLNPPRPLPGHRSTRASKRATRTAIRFASRSSGGTDGRMVLSKGSKTNVAPERHARRARRSRSRDGHGRARRAARRRAPR